AEAALGRLRIEQAEADSRATAVREEAHARELDINRRQQQLEFNRQHAETLAARAGNIEAEIRDLGARRAPARLLIESRQAAAAEAERERVEVEGVAAAGALLSAQEALEAVQAERAERESELASARIEYEERTRGVRMREQELAGLGARLASLEELEASRAGFSDAA